MNKSRKLTPVVGLVVAGVAGVSYACYQEISLTCVEANTYLGSSWNEAGFCYDDNYTSTTWYKYQPYSTSSGWAALDYTNVCSGPAHMTNCVDLKRYSIGIQGTTTTPYWRVNYQNTCGGGS